MLASNGDTSIAKAEHLKLPANICKFLMFDIEPYS
jgi:hypothetical protein